MRRLLRKPADLRGQRHGHGCALPGAAWAGQSPENTRQAGLGGNPAHGEERLRLFVVGRQIIIGQRPCAASVSRLGSKLLGGKAQQGGAVPLGLAADVDVFLGLQRTALAVHPRLPRQEFPAVDDAFNIEGTAIRVQPAWRGEAETRSTVYISPAEMAASATKATSRPAAPGSVRTQETGGEVNLAPSSRRATNTPASPPVNCAKMYASASSDRILFRR